MFNGNGQELQEEYIFIIIKLLAKPMAIYTTNHVIHIHIFRTNIMLYGVYFIIYESKYIHPMTNSANDHYKPKHIAKHNII